MKYHLQQLPVERADQRSFHIASQTYLRIEFVRLDAEQTLGPIAYQGDVVVTCVEGAVGLSSQELTTLEQCVVSQGEELELVGLAETSVVQLIWSPPFAECAFCSSEQSSSA